MEVHVRNVPEKSTQNALQKYLKGIFAKLQIRCVLVTKSPNKNFATIAFLNLDDAQRFLQRHGQTRLAPKTRPIRNNQSELLRFLGQPIYCEKSNREELNPHTKRVLEKEEKDRVARLSLPRGTEESYKDAGPVSFESFQLSCGTWQYPDSELVYSPEVTWTVKGKVKFGERSMILHLDSGFRIDFHYFSIYELVTEEGGNPALTFSMLEAPRIFQKTGDAIEALMAALQVNARGHLVRKNGPDRQRVPAIDESHEAVVGSCFVYRIELYNDHERPSHEGDIGDRFQILGHIAGMPTVTHSHVPGEPVGESFYNSFRALKESLSSIDLKLPFSVRFQLQKLAQGGYLAPNVVLEMMPEVGEILKTTTETICISAIRKLFNQIPFRGPETDPSHFQAEPLLELLKENVVKSQEEAALVELQPDQSRNVAIIHRAKITPTGILLYGPEAETNNRVLRKYPTRHEYFLRVQFCDEDGQPVRFNPRVSNERIYHERFKRILNTGIVIGNRTFTFLGFSHSSLRAQSVWFVAPFVDPTTEGLIFDTTIINELGNFSVIRSPAKCAARIGQAFSDTRTAITIDLTTIRRIRDVERGDPKRVFSDGVGTVSQAMIQRIWDNIPKAGYSKPKLFQIRIQGAKGMISLDTRLKGEVINLRPSMIKFEGSTSTDIEICEASYKPLPMYLNRQFIKILEDMGVKDSFFLQLQADEVRRLRMITESPINAAYFLKRQLIGQNIRIDWLIRKLAALGLDFRQDGFLKDMVEMAVLVELRLLKHKTRIPVKHGWHLHGLMDETGFLEEGQIYCSVNVDGQTTVITGERLIVTRAPCLHPGDIQLATGVRPPRNHPLLHLTNCICFSSKGERDLPSQLSGGDLDGDRYYIMWDKRAVPTYTFTPADYPRLPAIDIGRPVVRTDMAEFFIKFMETDQLGRIAVTHRVLADQRDAGTVDKDCITLAEMHSTAVDFSKTGIPVDMSKMPKYSPYRPDFEAPGPHIKIHPRAGINFEAPDHRDPVDLGDDDDDFSNYKYYESHKVLGKLYRAIDERAIFNQIKQKALIHGTSIDRNDTVIHQVWSWVQAKCALIEWKHHLEWAETIREMYEEKVLQIMTDYSEHPLRPLTELEAVIGNILGKTGVQSRHQRELSTSMKEKFEEESGFIVNCIVKEDGGRSEESLERSMAVLSVSLEEKGRWKRVGNVEWDGGKRRGEGGDRLVGFRYVAAGVCLREVERFLEASGAY